MFSPKRTVAAWLVPLAAATALLAAAPTSGASTTALLDPCPGDAYEQPFTPWLDVASYVLVPNGDLESRATGWTLAGGASAAAGNESYYVHRATDSTSLSLPSGSSATTSNMSVGATSPTLRLFVRNSGSLLSTLKVEVLYTDLLGQRRALPVGTVLGSSSWQPTLPIAFLANLTALPLLTDGTTSVAFRFTPQGSLGAWRIDDVYVDPFKGE